MCFLYQETRRNFFPHEQVSEDDVFTFLLSFIFCFLFAFSFSFSMFDFFLSFTTLLSHLDLDDAALALKESKLVLIPDAPVLLRSALESLSW